MCSVRAILLLLVIAPISYQHQQHQRTIYDRVMEEAQFSGYRTMIKNNKVVTLDLFYGAVTFLVPENAAFDEYDGTYTEDHVVLYHVGSEPYTLRDLRMNGSQRVLSVSADNPPLWVSVVEDGYYINNAKIVQWKSDYVGKCKRIQSLKQVLHVVDRVLDPMLQVPFSNPSALDFLQNYQHWKLGGRKVSNFYKRVKFFEKQDLYKKRGGHTFFVPVDDRRYDHRLQDIDRYIIEGHVVPNVVLFTRPSQKNFVYETVCNGDYIYMVLSLMVLNDKVHVKSYTVLGDTEHPKGEIVADIVKGDIPVFNGVVHLISKPLAVFDRALRPFPYLPVLYKISADPDLNTTFLVGGEGRINAVLRREKGMFTYFAPHNRAWTAYGGYAAPELADVLARHVVVGGGRHTMAQLAASTARGNATALETLAGTLRVRVRRAAAGFVVEYGGRLVRVLRADYECSDGVVHVVDGVFAAPRPPTAAPEPEASFWGTLKRMVT